MRLVHYCSSDALFEILKSRRFIAAYPSPSAGDSGINCFILGREYNFAQEFNGRGAYLYIEWSGEAIEVSNDKEFPLEPNILHNQERWRAIIPKGTDTNLIKVVDFEVERGELNFMSKFKCLWFKCKLKKKPIYLDL
ncbi:hypothetical protein [Aeromonas jandaei]|uniref:hypothetical protein n=1 Tax=Aeromonas jandaei TaxID=650 RepID=UPI00059DB15E|nr:hypothetical protein [Aeromonas jandaei]